MIEEATANRVRLLVVAGHPFLPIRKKGVPLPLPKGSTPTEVDLRLLARRLENMTGEPGSCAGRATGEPTDRIIPLR
jgi:hypothetical protein